MAGREHSKVILASSRMAKVDSRCSLALVGKSDVPSTCPSTLVQSHVTVL